MVFKFDYCSLSDSVILYYCSLFGLNNDNFRDKPEDLYRWYIYAKKIQIRREKYQCKKDQYFEFLERTFLDLYEQCQAKEKDEKIEKPNQTQRPFNYIKPIDSADAKIIRWLRQKDNRMEGN